MLASLRDLCRRRSVLAALSATAMLAAPASLGLSASPAGAATGCVPTANQVALFVNRSYGGNCAIFNIGAIPRTAVQGLTDNTVSSIKVGANVVAVVHQDPDFGGLDNYSWQSIAVSDVNLGDNLYPRLQSRADNQGRIEDSISALWVMRKGCLPAATQVAVFQGTNFGGACTLVGPGTFASAVSAGMPADFVGSLKVGTTTRVAVWEAPSFTGTTCTYNARALQGTICLGASRLSSIVVANDATPPSLAVTHVVDGQSGWNVAAPVTVSLVATDTGTGVLGSPTCKDNGAAITVSGSAPSFSTTVNGSGSHSVTCSARDRIGNAASASDTVKIDTASPSVSATPTVAGSPYTAGSWVNGDVRVAFGCTDTGSGVAVVSPAATVTGEGVAQSVTGTCSDKAGNSASRTVAPIAIDKTAPVVTAQRSPGPGDGGWVVTDVVVSFACSDELSGVATVSDPRTVSSDGADQSVTGTCTDRAGNRATATVGDIDIDQRAPVLSIGATAGGRPYVSGTWSKDDVVVMFACTDAGSGVASVTSPVTVATEGAAQEVTGACTDNLGNTTTRTFDGIAIDKGAPSLSSSATVDGEEYAPGVWTDQDVTVTFDCDDALSGVASVSAPAVVTTEGNGQSRSGSCTDKAGNTVSTTSTGINIDKHDPALAAAATAGPAPYQPGTWTNQPVVVRFTCTDAGSGVATVTAPATVSTEGEGQSVSGTCVDNLGRTTARTFGGIAIDLTAPTVTYTGNAGTYTYGDAISIRCAAADALSGVASSTCADVVNPSPPLGVGSHAFSATAVDRAGNHATGSTTVAIDARAVTTVASGTWSTPAVWSSGEAPGPNDRVIVAAGHSITVDVAAATVAGVTIEPHAALVFAPDRAVTFQSSRNIVVEGRLSMRPASVAVTHLLRFVGINERTFKGGGDTVLPTDVGLWVTGSGTLDAVGSPKTSWTRAAATVAAGSTSITLEHPPSGWQAGDEITIVPTEPPAAGSPAWQGFEDRTITGVSGTTVGFGPGTAREHPFVNGAWGAEVLNLTRNVRIEGTPTGRTHVMITAMVPQTISNVALRYTGPRQDRNGDGVTELVLGRYALHFHMGHDGTRGSTVEGVVARDGGSRAFVPHMSHGITFRDTIAYNQFADAYWWDEFQLTHDTLWDHAVAAFVKADPDNKAFRLSGFTLGRGEGNSVRDSVAVGVQGTKDASGFTWPETANGVPNAWEFTGNVTHNNKVDGIFTWQNTDGPHDVGPFVAYHNNGFGVDHGAYHNDYRYHDAVLFENRAGGIRQRATTRGNDPPLSFHGITVVGGPAAIELAEHNNGGGTVPTVYRDCAFSGQWMAKVNVVEAISSSRYDFINCNLEPSDFRLTSALPGMLIRVQRADLTAFQIDANGTVTTIPRFDPPDIPPAVRLTSPAPSATSTEPATIDISAEATDVDGTIRQVEFFVGETSLGVRAAGPYEITWDGVVAGTYRLTAVATDNDGAKTVSSPVTITVDPP